MKYLFILLVMFAACSDAEDKTTSQPFQLESNLDSSGNSAEGATESDTSKVESFKAEQTDFKVEFK